MPDMVTKRGLFVIGSRVISAPWADETTRELIKISSHAEGVSGAKIISYNTQVPYFNLYGSGSVPMENVLPLLPPASYKVLNEGSGATKYNNFLDAYSRLVSVTSRGNVNSVYGIYKLIGVGRKVGTQPSEIVVSEELGRRVHEATART